MSTIPFRRRNVVFTRTVFARPSRSNNLSRTITSWPALDLVTNTRGGCPKSRHPGNTDRSPRYGVCNQAANGKHGTLVTQRYFSLSTCHNRSRPKEPQIQFRKITQSPITKVDSGLIRKQGPLEYVPRPRKVETGSIPASATEKEKEKQTSSTDPSSKTETEATLTTKPRRKHDSSSPAPVRIRRRQAFYIRKHKVDDGPPKPPLAIVFTDIVKSTAIWESQPESMAKALQIHDSIIRDLTSTHNGYEVKQNGDGFMLAFPSAVSAVQFCIDAQVRLLEVEWPEELLEVGAGSEVREPVTDVVEDEDAKEKLGISDGTQEDEDDMKAPKETNDASSSSESKEKVLFRGLRLRMSAHFGSPIQSYNSVINRMDYFGPMVNRAARFIQATEGGQIVVSKQFLDELRKAKIDSKSQEQSKQEQDREQDNDGTVQTESVKSEGPLFDLPTREAGITNTNNNGKSTVARGEGKAEDEQEEGDAVELDLSNLQCEKTQSEPKDRQFEVRLLGKRHFKGLSQKEKLYFIVPHSLKGRLKYWPRHKHVTGSKGNLVDG